MQDPAQTEELLRAQAIPDGLPPDTVIAIERDKETERVLAAYLVAEGGRHHGRLPGGRARRLRHRQRPIVAFTFNREGGEHLRRSSPASNVGKQLAIVLDDRVYSAPMIRSRIGDARPDRGPLHAAGGGRPRRRAALGLALDPGDDRGGAHGRARRSARTRSARAQRRRRRASSLVVGFCVRLLPALGRLRDARADREPRPADRPDVAVRRHADACRASRASCSRSAWRSTPT